MNRADLPGVQYSVAPVDRITPFSEICSGRIRNFSFSYQFSGIFWCYVKFPVEFWENKSGAKCVRLKPKTFKRREVDEMNGSNGRKPSLLSAPAGPGSNDDLKSSLSRQTG